jgi:kynurenine formamidase
MENANLEPVDDARVGVALLIVTPLRIEGASGSPLRVLAIA